MNPAAAPAGFWRRGFAYTLDWLLLSALLFWLLAPILLAAWQSFVQVHESLQEWLLERLLSASTLPSPLDLARAALHDPALRGVIDGALASISLGVLKASLIAAGAAALYFVGFEASAWQATPGKRLLGLRVRTLDGDRISLGQAAARFAAGTLSWATLNLGHALAGFRSDGRALHDLLAGTRVDRASVTGDQTSI